MSSVLDLSGYSLQTTGKRLCLVEEVREIPGIPVQLSIEVCALVAYHRLYFLSLFLGSRVQILEPVFEGKRLSVGFIVEKDVETQELRAFDKAFGRMLSMPKELLEAYLNSCSAYHSALLLRESNYSVAFVLLVIAIESLSNKYYSKGRLKRRFKKFVAHFLPGGRAFVSSELRKGLADEQARILLLRLLESVYREVRSGFVHYGKAGPVGSIYADRLRLAYIKIGEDPELPEREQYIFLNPSLGWFKRIAGEVLINFLSLKESKEHNDLHSLLLERLITKVKAGKSPVQKGQHLTENDLELQ